MKQEELKTVLVIGSGPIVIGQAAEFDYSGTQACLALKEEGFRVILVNSNPATMMTDTEIADVIYMEPLTVEFIGKIIRKEKPQALLATVGGQTALNLAVELERSGILAQYGIELIGTKLASIKKAEDREEFRDFMKKIGEPVPESTICTTVEEAEAFADRVGYPVIVRPAFTLAGSGGGICRNIEELREVARSGIRYSPSGQILVEKSIAGYKEIELEVVRDSQDQVAVICSLENVDPVGIHTGDSLVVAPYQTLSREEYLMLRDAAVRIVRGLEIEGGCNVQLAFNQEEKTYYVIEVNPRVSRSSALASKVTGIPIAKIAAKIAIGRTLDELIPAFPEQPSRIFEPELDYIVTKLPRFPFDKFRSARRNLGTQMQATGEVMAIGKTFEESLLKAVRSLELGVDHLELKDEEEISLARLEKRIKKPGDERLFYIAEAFRRGISSETIQRWSKIDSLFLKKINKIIQMERELAKHRFDQDMLRKAKQMGFADGKIAKIWRVTESTIKEFRQQNEILPVYQTIDARELVSKQVSRYFYSTYHEVKNKSFRSDKEKILIPGSGPIRIGQGLEFDYATVHAVLALQAAGYEAIVINNNPETVSTDYTIGDKLYFEPLTVEDVMHVVEQEKPKGVIVQFGGQTAINLAMSLHEQGVPILGTSPENIHRAEDRQAFETLLRTLEIPHPTGKAARNRGEAVAIAREIGYPVLARPSYVLGGEAMEILENEEELLAYSERVFNEAPDREVLIDAYVSGREIEVDAISDGEHVLIPGIMEHIERAGVHSGDSIAIYPALHLTKELKEKIVVYTERLARALNIVGLLNIQFVIRNREVYVLEANPRSSRTVPFLSKITGLPIVALATKVLLGERLKDLGYGTGLYPEPERYFVKVPVFSLAKLKNVDIALGPEMKSTGEVIGHDRDIHKALYKGLVAAGMNIAEEGTILFTIADQDKPDASRLAKEFLELGYNIIATEGTANYFRKVGIPVQRVDKIHSDKPDNLLNWIRSGKVQLVINTISKGTGPERDGFKIRRTAVEYQIPCLTSLDTATALLQVLQARMVTLEPIGSANIRKKG